MPWIFIPYKRDTTQTTPTRYCEIEDYFDQINAEGGSYAYAEVKGNYALCKLVGVSAGLLQTLAALPGWRRLPKDLLDETLADLTTPQRNQLRDFILSLGYSLSELQTEFPNDLRTYTLRQVLRFAATRRIAPMYNQATDTITLSGAIVQPSPQPDELDTQVQDITVQSEEQRPFYSYRPAPGVNDPFNSQ